MPLTKPSHIKARDLGIAVIAVTVEFFTRPPFCRVSAPAASDEHSPKEPTAQGLSVLQIHQQMGRNCVASGLEQLSRPIWNDPAWLAEVDDSTLSEQD